MDRPHQDTLSGGDGKFFKSSDVGQADEAPEEAAVPVAEIGEILEPVRKRVTGKSQLRELGLSYEVVEAQRQTGLELLQERARPRGGDLHKDAHGSGGGTLKGSSRRSQGRGGSELADDREGW